MRRFLFALALMTATVSHVLSATTPDNASYEIRPSHWNSLHAVTLDAAGSELTNAFGNGGGVTFGLSADGKITAAGPAYQAVGNYLTTARASNDAVGLNTAKTNVTWTVNSSGISFDAGGYLTTARASTDAIGLNTAKTNVTWTVNSSGISLDAGGYLTTARRSTDAVGLNTAQTNVTWTVNSSGISLNAAGYNGTGFTSTSTAGSDIQATNNTSGLSMAIPAYLTTARRSTDGVGLNTAQTNVTWTVNSSGISLNAGGYNGTGFTSTTTAGTAIVATNNTAGLSMAVPAFITAGVATLNRYAPWDLITGSVLTSVAPASWFFNMANLPNPVAVKQIQLIKSWNAGVPAATSAASTGTLRFSYSHGITIFTRQDFGANSTNISYLTSASGGLTAGLSYSSTSQSFVVSWVTDSTGGTTSFGTTSSAGNWSNFMTGQKLFVIPLVTTLTAGEYFIAHAHSSTSGTTNSNLTLLSVSMYGFSPQAQSYGVYSSSGALPWAHVYGGNIGFGIGRISGVTTNATMAGSLLNSAANVIFPIQFINATGDSN